MALRGLVALIRLQSHVGDLVRGGTPSADTPNPTSRSDTGHPQATSISHSQRGTDFDLPIKGGEEVCPPPVRGEERPRPVNKRICLLILEGSYLKS
jgi:hypothetical protein